MPLPPFIAKYFSNSEYSILVKRNEMLAHQTKNLIGKLQATTDITTNTDTTSTRHYVGTPSKYSTYLQQVTQLGKLYDNKADWGCMIAKNVIDMRTAFSVGKGIRCIKRAHFEGDAEAELTWCKEFMRYNNLDEEMPQEYAKEAEIEGKILLRLMWQPDTRQVRVVYVPWRLFSYTISTPSYDFFSYTNASYQASNIPENNFNLSPEFFVYKRFGGGAYQINETPSKTTFVLREMEDLDRGLWDWRKTNNLFAAPTPVFLTPDKQTAQALQAWLDGSNWKIGMALVLGGENVSFDMVGWKGDGYTTLKEETQALAKTISGTTGIPVHFLGYPELLSNRDTAENLIELIALSTNKERNTWTGAYEELFQKALAIYNVAMGTNFNPLAVGAVVDKPELTTVTGAPNAAVSKSNTTSGESKRDSGDS